VTRGIPRKVIEIGDDEEGLHQDGLIITFQFGVETLRKPVVESNEVDEIEVADNDG